MRLSSLLDFLKRIDVTTYAPKVMGTTDKGETVLVHLNRLRSLFQEMKYFPGLGAIASQFEDAFPVFSRTEDSLRVATGEHHKLQAALDRLRDVFSVLKMALESVLPELSEEVIRIRLPDEIDYHAVIADLGKIFKILEQSLIDFPLADDHAPTQIRLLGWETGSWWIDVAVGSAELVAIVGSIAWGAAVVRRKWAEGTLMIEKAREVGAEADVVEHLGKKLKESIDVVVDTEAKNIAATHGRGRLGFEHQERLKYSIRELFEMISRGAEIHPALMEPSKATDLFPDFSKLNTISSKVRELPQSSAEET